MTASEDLTNRKVRQRARAIFDRLIDTQRRIIAQRTDIDGRWATPIDLADFGDGTGLLGVGAHQLVGPMQAAVNQAQDEMRALWAEIEADKRRRIGPGYQPPSRRR